MDIEDSGIWPLFEYKSCILYFKDSRTVFIFCFIRYKIKNTIITSFNCCLGFFSVFSLVAEKDRRHDMYFTCG
jgi:hypothetical protein